MMRKFKALLLLAAAFSLSACSDTPEGYVESPALSKFFKAQLPADGRLGIDSISVCQDFRDYEHWYTSIMFDDGEIYHYQLDSAKKAVLPVDFGNLGGQSTKYGNVSGTYGCLGWMGTNFEFFAKGDYRFSFRHFSVVGLVSRSAFYGAFDDAVKDRLSLAADATKAAIKVHAEFVPKSNSWGATESKKCVPTVGYSHSEKCGREQLAD